MPNKRAENKTKIAAWVDKDTKLAVQKILDKRGLTITDEILNLLNQILQREIENEKNKRDHKKD